jgi:hypothetical protein
MPLPGTDIVNQLGYTASAVGKARHRGEKLFGDKELRVFVEFVVLSRTSLEILRSTPKYAFR